MRVSETRFSIEGHRGARGLFPENTLEGFRAALALGVDGFELDVGVTADGVIVVAHDPALNPAITRARDGTWLAGGGPLIRSLRYDEILSFDVGRVRPGSGYAADFPDQQAMDGARIPRLADVLAISGAPQLTIELKTFPDHPEWTVDPVAMADATLAVVDNAGALSRVMLESFDWRSLRYIRSARPDVRLGWLTRASLGAATRLWWNGVDASDHGGSVPRAVAAQQATTWLPEHRDLTRAQVREAHDLGMRVIAWTVNTVPDRDRLMEWGVDRIISDRPDLMKVFAE